MAEIDIWRVAYLMLCWYGESAAAESTRRSEEIAAAGDPAGTAAWRRVVAAIGELANTTPPGLLH